MSHCFLNFNYPIYPSNNILRKRSFLIPKMEISKAKHSRYSFTITMTFCRTKTTMYFKYDQTLYGPSFLKKGYEIGELKLKCLLLKINFAQMNRLLVFLLNLSRNSLSCNSNVHESENKIPAEKL